MTIEDYEPGKWREGRQFEKVLTPHQRYMKKDYEEHREERKAYGKAYYYRKKAERKEAEREAAETNARYERLREQLIRYAPLVEAETNPTIKQELKRTLDTIKARLKEFTDD
jgi:hypothetical protein